MTADLISRAAALRAVEELQRVDGVSATHGSPKLRDRLSRRQVLAALRSLPGVEAANPPGSPVGSPSIDEEHEAGLASQPLDAEPCDECGEFFDPCELHTIGGDSVCGACARSLCPDEFGEEESDEG